MNEAIYQEHREKQSLPLPPLPCYPTPPQEPSWREERQHEHTRSLYRFVGQLCAWVELCRLEYSFRQELYLPVASDEDWDEFVQESMSFIGKWIELLKIFANDDDDDS